MPIKKWGKWTFILRIFNDQEIVVREKAAVALVFGGFLPSKIYSKEHVRIIFNCPLLFFNYGDLLRIFWLTENLWQSCWIGCERK